MGGMARLRADAADRLQITGLSLSGYADGKVMVQHERLTLLLPEKTPVVALFHLSRNNEYSAKPTSNGYIILLNTANAVTQASTIAIGLDRNSMQWRTNRFHVAAEFGKTQIIL